MSLITKIFFYWYLLLPGKLTHVHIDFYLVSLSVLFMFVQCVCVCVCVCVCDLLQWS